MHENHPEITEKLRSTGRTLKYLTDTLKLDYNRVVRFINGFGPLPPEEQAKINEQLDLWVADAEAQG